MLKHVHNTLSRRASNKSSSGPPRCPPSPAPSIISSCSSLSSGSTFFSASPSSSSNSSSNSNTSDEVGLGIENHLGHYSNGSLLCSDTSTSCLQLPAAAFRDNLNQSEQSEESLWARRRPRSLASESRAGSRLSISSNASSTGDQPTNAVPLRIYAACLRPDIQYKTVGVNHGTTCEQVINSLLNKCKLRYKDPKLFILAMEMKIRAPNGADIEASIPLEETARPLQLQECYPRGQAKFSLKMNTAACRLVKVYDETGMLGWQYKGIMISEKTTAGELIKILFRFTSILNTRNLPDQRNTIYSLHLEVNQTWRQKLSHNDMVVPMQSIVTSQYGSHSTKLVLQALRPHPHHSMDSIALTSRLSLTEFHQNLPTYPSRNSTISLYDNVLLNQSPNSLSPCSDHHDCSKCTDYWRRRRSHSLSLSSSSGGSSSQSTPPQDGTGSRTRNYEINEDAETMLLNGFNRFGITNNSGRRLIRQSSHQNQKYEFFV